MPGRHTEKAFETAIEEYLLTGGGYSKGDREAFDREHCIDQKTFLGFVQETQPKEWEYLKNLQKDRAEGTLLDDLVRSLNSEHEGCLSVLRHGFKCFGKLFHAAYFAPASGMNPETQKLYAANRLTITRQLRYSERHGNTLDTTIALNGIPVVTAELKNPMTGQAWRNAVQQYKHDRDPSDLMFQFKKRTLVHFAVDPDEVYMTTRLAGGNTHFLPLNRGCAGGAGNPDNPNGWKTAYLWEAVLERHSFLDILARFIHLQIEERNLGGKKVKRETMIFPRYHQLDCVRKAVADAREKGAGINYLVEHSAGSGKSNSIAWLAHRLASLYDAKDQRVFDSVIVVTDRVVLDQQLQNEELTARYMNDKEFQGVVGRHLLKEVYEQIRSQEPIFAATDPFRRVTPREEEKYRTCVPLLTLKAAAGAFGSSQAVESDGWVEFKTSRRLRPGMFVGQVVGRSMAPRIPNGSWCLFQGPVEGSRQGRTVLVQHRDISDPETGGSYTVKRYRSEKEGDGTGNWKHAEIRLLPENPEFAPLILKDIADDELRVIAEFVEVIEGAA